MRIYPLIGGSICAVVLIVLTSLTNVVGYQTVQSSRPLDLSPGSSQLEEKTKNHFLYFSVILKNYGNTDLNNVYWDVYISVFHSFIIYPKTPLRNSIDVLKPNETYFGKVNMLGLGLITIIIQYGFWYVQSGVNVYKALVLGPFILWLVQILPQQKI